VAGGTPDSAQTGDKGEAGNFPFRSELQLNQRWRKIQRSSGPGARGNAFYG
jgi:hypothetical protein